MKNRLQGLLKDRKILYLVLFIAVVSVFTLSIAYAAMSAVLEIHGNSEVVASSWDIHLENVKVKSGSVSANAPSISGTSSVGFDVELNTPGEFYEFTVDVVNDGSIDAMIDSVVKTPDLTSEQAKYIKYEITYENGESISTKQTLKKGTTTPIKVRVEYRKDLVASDLPSTVTELSLKLTLVYVQSDGTGNEIPNNGTKLVNVVSGDGTQVGNEVCIGNECFYVISSDDSSITMLSKYNLYVGYKVIEYITDPEVGELYVTEELEKPTGIQNSLAGGYGVGDFPFIGTIEFARDDEVYSGSVAEEYVINYNNYFVSLGVIPIEARLITYDELIDLGCYYGRYGYTCIGAPEWVYSTAYWTMSVEFSDRVYSVWASGGLSGYIPREGGIFGVRPVITISRDYL